MNHLCNICGGAAVHKLSLELVGYPHAPSLGGGGYREEIVFCPDCGYAWIANPLDTEDFYAGERNKYNRGGLIGTGPGESNDHLIREVWKHNISLIHHFAGDARRALEVGCARGYGLNEVRKSGLAVKGIEPNAANAKAAGELCGAEIFSGFLSDYPGKRERFDLVILSHVLEHVPDRFTFLRQAAELSGQYVLVAVPLIDMPFRSIPYGLFVDEHISYFSYHTVAVMMDRLGFGCVANQMFTLDRYFSPPTSLCLASLWSRSAGRIDPKAIKPVISPEQAFDAYLAWSAAAAARIDMEVKALPPKAKIAVWGVSDTFYSFAGYTDILSRQVVRFWDSDERHRGRQIGGVGVTPYHPEDIKNGEVDTVIVCACKAEKEILEILAPWQGGLRILSLYSLSKNVM